LRSEQDDSDGQIEETYVPLSEVWADVRMVSGKEFIEGGARQSSVVATIRIRYRPGLEASMRVLHDARTFHVEAILDDPKSGRDWVTLACSEVRS